MSMINDALRRASDAAKNAPEPPPLPVTPLAVSEPPPLIATPVEETLSLRPLETQPRSRLPYILAILLFCCMAGAAVVYVWEKQKKTTRAQTEKTVVTALASRTSPATTPEATAMTQTPAAPANQTPVAVSPSVAAAPVPAASPAPAASGPPVKSVSVRFPPLRLQSIFYRPSNPSVMINGRTLFVGDEIEGVRIAAIESSSVTLVLSGQTNVLTLR